jgi:hypothetical protein
MRDITSILIGMLVAALFLAPIASADTYVGGIPLKTVEEGVVSGGLYYDAFYGLGGTTVQKGFAVPAHTGVKWARLYVAVYCGNMQDNYPVAMDLRFDGDGDGIYERSWNEYMNSGYGWPGEGGAGPVEFGNGNRVTSDYLYWYDVGGLIKGTKVNAEVKTARPASYTGTFDGRIKLVALVVAYDDGTTDQVYYQVNQGHDASSYHDEVYVGQTGFDLPVADDDPVAATLAVIHLSSVDGRYWINGEEFEGRKPQGSYSGSNRWDVLDQVTGESALTLDYQKQPDDTFFKIPLALLTISYPEEEPKVGEISVESTPAGAWVFVDGVNTTKKTPVLLQNILVGDHSVAVKLAGYKDASLEVVVIEDDLIELNFEPEREIIAPSGDGGEGTAGTGYHGGPLDLYRRGEINGTLSMTTAGIYTGLLEVGKGDEQTHQLLLPENATVADGRLYVYTTWGHNTNSREGRTPTMKVMMDGYSLPLAATYGDRKGYGAFDYIVNTFAFDLDERIRSSGNYTFTITNDGSSGDTFALYGSSLLILSEVPDAPVIEYWITEGCDAVLADPAFGTTTEDATTTAYFDGVPDIGTISHAELIAVSTAASGLAGGLNRVMMNDMEWVNTLTAGSSEISLIKLPVRDHLIESENTALLQSYADDGGTGDYMENRHLILTIRKRGVEDAVDDPSLIIMPEERLSVGTAVYAVDDGRIPATRLESGMLSLIISEGSRVWGGEGYISSRLTLKPVTSIPPGTGTIPGIAFQIEPQDGEIDIPIILTAPGNEQSIILRYDPLLKDWISVTSRYDEGSATVSARITRLGMYGIAEGESQQETGRKEERERSTISLQDIRDVRSIFPWMGLNGIRSAAPVHPEDEPLLPDDGLILPDVIRIDHTNTSYPLTVRSNPPGALISLDGEYLGKVTPSTISDLPSGLYTIDLSLDDFISVSESVVLTMEQVVTLDLPVSASGSRVLKVEDPDLYSVTIGGIYVTSRPDEAEIYLDGRRIGRTTPQVIYGVTPGIHTVRLRLKDVTFPVETKEVRVYPGEVTPVSFARHDEVYTRTVIIDNPVFEGMAFSINGLMQSEKIPAEVDVRGLNPYLTVNTGESYLTYRISGDRIDWSDPVNGSIQVESSPAGGAITLDGFSTGLHTPATIENISAGPHRLLVSRPGHLPAEADFWMTPSIHDGVSETFRFTLVRYIFGTLRIESTPPGARIYLYGQNTGLLTPQSIPFMNIGGYTLRLTGKGGAKTVETTVHPYQVTGVVESFT